MAEKKGRKEEKERGWTLWHIRVPYLLDSEVEKCIDTEPYISKAEFIRAAVREQIESKKREEKDRRSE